MLYINPFFIIGVSTKIGNNYYFILRKKTHLPKLIAIICLDLYKPPISFIEVLGLVRLRLREKNDISISHIIFFSYQNC